MSKTAADVLKLIKEQGIKFVDLRFTDTRGKEQHVGVPVSAVDESKFEEGHAFDGSSIAGWKGIQASDMLLMLDPDSAYVDPFFDEPTLIITCDVIEPTDGKGYDRDPRSIAKRAEAYLKSTGIGDTAYFGPEPEFFIFDSVQWNVDMSGCFLKINSEEAAWSTGEKFEGGNTGHRPMVKGGYFPVNPVDSGQDLRGEMLSVMKDLGLEPEKHHHEVAPAQHELGLGQQALERLQAISLRAQLAGDLARALHGAVDDPQAARVALHDGALGIIEAAGLEQHVVWNADLADVVHLACKAQQFDLIGAKAGKFAQTLAAKTHPENVVTGLVVTEFTGPRQGADDLDLRRPQ